MERSEYIMEEMFDKFKTLNIHENRALTDEYCELVFFNKEIDIWEKIIIDNFGAAVKPAKVKPTEGDLSITREFGGIYTEQTLFRKKYGSDTVIAMLWPWQDPAYTTLKIVLLKKD